MDSAISLKIKLTHNSDSKVYSVIKRFQMDISSALDENNTIGITLRLYRHGEQLMARVRPRHAHMDGGEMIYRHAKGDEHLLVVPVKDSLSVVTRKMEEHGWHLNEEPIQSYTTSQSAQLGPS